LLLSWALNRVDPSAVLTVARSVDPFKDNRHLAAARETKWCEKIELSGKSGEFSCLRNLLHPYDIVVDIVIRARNAWQPFVLSA
jgi:hypothetical protein